MIECPLTHEADEPRSAQSLYERGSSPARKGNTLQRSCVAGLIEGRRSCRMLVLMARRETRFRRDSAGDGIKVKTLLHGGVVVTCDDRHTVHQSGDVLIEDDHIAYVGS